MTKPGAGSAKSGAGSHQVWYWAAPRLVLSLFWLLLGSNLTLIWLLLGSYLIRTPFITGLYPAYTRPIATRSIYEGYIYRIRVR